MTTIETTGHMIDAHTMHLKDPVPEMNRELSITVRDNVAEVPKDIFAALEWIRESQRKRGHSPPTREEVDAYIKAERDSWGD